MNSTPPPGDQPGRETVPGVIREERDFSEAVINSLPGVFYLYDDKRKFLRWNRNFEQVTGYTGAEIGGMDPLDFFGGEEKALLKGKIEEVFAAGVANVEAGFVTKDGRVIPYYFTGVRATIGGRTCLLGVGIDVTERRRVEEAHRMTEARYQTLFEYAPDGIVIADPQGVYLEANSSLCRMLGYARGELVGMDAKSIVVPSEIPEIAPALEAITVGVDYHREWQFRRKDGTAFPAEVIATKMPDGNLLAMFRDITARREAEASLRESEQRFRELAENINEIFWIVDPAKVQLLYVSPAYEKIWGRSCEALYRSPGTWMDGIHEDDRERVRVAVRNEARSGYDETYRIVRPDGAIRWVRDRGFPVTNDRGEVYRVVGTAQDITERRLLEEQLRQSQKMEAIGQLSGGVAHDFNNLLTVIHGHVGLLQMKGQVSPEIANSIHQISEAANRAGNLTRQLLTFSRQQEMRQAEHNLNGLVANMLKMLRRLLGEHIELTVDYSPEPIPIRADGGMVEQVLLNLVVNARDAMPQGGMLRIATAALEIDESAAAGTAQGRPGLFACLTVSDTGEGIPPEIIPRIFEPFFTTKAAGQGTGLGLATVYGIMRQHEGWIEVESRRGLGTVFRAYFPRQAGAMASVMTRQASAMRGGHETILLVEDDAAVRALAVQALRGLGYRVLPASDGPEAMQLWQAHRHEVDLLITDLVMPGGINGRELAERLLPDNPAMPVIYMSGYSHEVAGKDLILEEGRNYLPKPFDMDSLARTIRARLDRRGSAAPFGTIPPP